MSGRIWRLRITGVRAGMPKRATHSNAPWTWRKKSARHGLMMPKSYRTWPRITLSSVTWSRQWNGSGRRERWRRAMWMRFWISEAYEEMHMRKEALAELEHAFRLGLSID